MNRKKSDKPWFIYLIKNKLNQLYCGVTVDVERRYFEHASNHAKCARALKGKHPLTLVFCAEVGKQSEALKIEYWLKQQTRHYKNQIISGSSSLPIKHQALDHKAIETIVMNKIKNQSSVEKLTGKKP